MNSLLPVVHLLGLALATGAATVKAAMAFRALREPDFVRNFLSSRKLVAKFIILGLILVTVSGIAWIVQGYPWSALLIAKVVIVVLMWVVGPIIDNVLEPRLEKLAPAGGQAPSSEFAAQQRTHLGAEIAATILMYAAFVLGTQL
jgi:hypothetical protein